MTSKDRPESRKANESCRSQKVSECFGPATSDLARSRNLVGSRTTCYGRPAPVSRYVNWTIEYMYVADNRSGMERAEARPNTGRNVAESCARIFRELGRKSRRLRRQVFTKFLWSLSPSFELSRAPVKLKGASSTEESRTVKCSLPRSTNEPRGRGACISQGAYDGQCFHSCTI